MQTVRRNTKFLLPIAFLAFVSIGVPDSVLGVAWPSIRHTFGLPLSQLGSLLMSGMVGYLISCFWGGTLVNRLGVGRLLFISSVMIVASATAYAVAPSWWVMVAFGVVSGLGAGAVDAGLNTYAAKHFSPRVMNWMHACYGIGAASGPVMMTAILVAGHSWRWGYGGVAIVMAAMTVMFGLTMRLWADDANGDDSASVVELPVAMTVVMRRPLVWMHTGLFFAYAGVEATAGQWAFSLFTEGRGMPTNVAGAAVSIYWASLTAGRIVFGAVDGRVSPDAILRLATLGCPLAAVLLGMNLTPSMNVFALALLGFACAPIFPLLISRTPVRLSESHSAHAIGFQVAAAYLGIAGIPGLTGLLARRYGLEVVVPVIFGSAIIVLLLHEAVLRKVRREENPILAAAAEPIA